MAELDFVMFQRENDSASNDDDLSGESADNLWYVGVILYAMGAFCMALGVVLQKLSINREFMKQSDASLHRPKWRQPVWVTGIVLYGSSGGLMSAALGFAAQSLLTPLMAIVIVSNALLSRFLLGEPLTSRDFKCVVIIILAVITTTLSSPDTEKQHTTEELIELYGEPLFIVYVVALVSLMASFYGINVYVRRKMVNREYVSDREQFLFSFSFGASAGCWGGLCVTMMKSAITIIVDKFSNEGLGGIFTTPLMYLLVGILCLCWYFQLRWINWGLEQFPAVFVVSIEAVLNKLVGVLGGLLYFEEYLAFSIGQGVGFSLGLIGGVTGIIIFAMRDNTVTADKDFFLNLKAKYPQLGFLCCPCCTRTLEADIEEKEVEKDGRKASMVSIKAKPKRHSVKRVSLRRRSKASSNEDVFYVDENGRKLTNFDDDLIVEEKVASPLNLAVDAAVAGATAAVGFLRSSLKEAVNHDENENTRKNKKKDEDDDTIPPSV